MRPVHAQRGDGVMDADMMGLGRARLLSPRADQHKPRAQNCKEQVEKVVSTESEQVNSVRWLGGRPTRGSERERKGELGGRWGILYRFRLAEWSGGVFYRGHTVWSPSPALRRPDTTTDPPAIPVRCDPMTHASPPEHATRFMAHLAVYRHEHASADGHSASAVYPIRALLHLGSHSPMEDPSWYRL
ncbi:hypothetical protein N7510_001740 [Penicillium lagena]|uniref:uncharacterized protein n=1 Tax=Penicillium lagena TaxID=94218 RepID=UPI0025422CC4|nr:uncharacterized protein N7510_001740 [Penicillium lagena]KAJ5625431.1 hypothetical protein N7510_001740 [Penicillium lagena]